jgi:hypothetical protein
MAPQSWAAFRLAAAPLFPTFSPPVITDNRPELSHLLPTIPGSDLDLACERTLAAFRSQFPGAFDCKPLGPGEVAPEVTIGAEQALNLYRIAFTEATGAARVNAAEIVWIDVTTSS